MKTLPVVHGETIDIYMMESYRARDLFQNANVEKYSVIEQLPDGSFYERIFACKETKKDGFVWQEIMAVSEKYGKIGRNIFWCDSCYCTGMHVFGFDEKDYVNRYYGESIEYSPVMFQLTDYIAEKRVYRECFTSLDDVIRLDPSLKYCAYNDMCGSIDLIDYIAIYRRYPIAEMLMKCEIFGMFNDTALQTITDDKTFRTWLYRNKDNLNVLSFRTAFNSYKKNPEMNPDEYSNEISKRVMYAKKTSFTDKVLYKKIRKHATAEKIYDYLKNKSINQYTYEDYIRACDWLELDLSDTKVLFPKNFRKYHDDYTKQYDDYHRKQEMKAKRAMIADIDRRMADTADRCSYLEYHDRKYKVIIARTKKELIHEGSVLHHCVGRMGYDKKQADGTSVICFIRRYGKLDKPFVTVQVDLKNISVMQCYGDHDNVVHDVDGFVKDWIQNAKAMNKKLQRKVA